MTPPLARRPRPRGSPRHSDAAGSLAVVQATWLLVLVVLVALAVLDVGALLRGARMAAAAADGAALAAATATRPSSPVTPRAAANRVAAAHDARVATCDCASLPATVEVVLPVSSRFLHHLGLTEAHATATADLVRHPTDDP